MEVTLTGLVAQLGAVSQKHAVSLTAMVTSCSEGAVHKRLQRLVRAGVVTGRRRSEIGLPQTQGIERFLTIGPKYYTVSGRRQTVSAQDDRHSYVTPCEMLLFGAEALRRSLSGEVPARGKAWRHLLLNRRATMPLCDWRCKYDELHSPLHEFQPDELPIGFLDPATDGAALLLPGAWAGPQLRPRLMRMLERLVPVTFVMAPRGAASRRALLEPYGAHPPRWVGQARNSLSFLPGPRSRASWRDFWESLDALVIRSLGREGSSSQVNQLITLGEPASGG